MDQHFVSEALVPLGPSGKDAATMARGEPGLPGSFVWRARRFDVAEVLARWRGTGPCRNGSGERYVRRHWYVLRTPGGAQLTVYFDRQPRAGALTRRWWLYTLQEADAASAGGTGIGRERALAPEA